MIVVNYGRDWAKVTYDALAASDISERLKPSYRVAVKPNLILASPAANGATTHPEVVEGVVMFLRDFGVSCVKIIESAWVGDCTKRAFHVCGYEELGRRLGVGLVDLKDDTYTTLRHNETGLDISICDEALGSDFLINVPVLKAHCQTLMTNAMKNLKGCIPDAEKRRFHTIGLHKPIAALAALMTRETPGYVVVDGICGDLSFEEGGSPVEANRIITGSDPLEVDSYCAGLIGYAPDEIGYITHAAEFGFGELFSERTRLVELNASDKPLTPATGSRVASRYRSVIDEDGACSACYAALIFALHRHGSYAGGKISIGQGFRGKHGNGLGIGNCAAGFERNVRGCPPTAAEVLREIRG